MKTNSKIEAFTLSEMVIVLILTSIVVGLAFSVLSLVQKHMAGIQNNFMHNTELNKLEQSLWIDFNRFTKIEYSTLEDELKFSNQINSIYYQFHEAYIIKNIDTFNIQLQNKSFFFDGEIIDSGLIDAVKFEISKTYQSKNLFVFKENDASPFIN